MASTDDLIAFFTLLLFSSVTFLAYSLAMASIRKVFLKTKSSFYLLLIALGICDCTMCALFLFYSTTATILQRPPLGPEFDALFGGFLCNLTYYTCLPLYVAIAWNRYCAICSKTPMAKVYQKRTVLLNIAVCVGIGFFSSLAQLTPCCSMRYFEHDYAWGFDMDLDGNAYFVWYDRSINFVAFLFVTVFYTLIVLKVRSAKKVQALVAHSNSHAQQRRNADVRLAIQTGLSTLVLTIFGFAFSIAPFLTSSKWWFLFGSVAYIAGTIGVHPVVYFTCNSDVRGKAKEIITFKKKVAEGALSMGQSDTVTMRVTKLDSVRNIAKCESY